MIARDRSFRSLSPRTRLAVGVGLMVWSTVGLYVTDGAEKKLGFEATERDKEALDSLTPKIHFIDRENP